MVSNAVVFKNKLKYEFHPYLFGKFRCFIRDSFYTKSTEIFWTDE